MQKSRLPICSACYTIIPRQRGRVERKDGQGLPEVGFHCREQRDHVAGGKNGFVDFQQSGFDTHSRGMRRTGKKTFECLPARSSTTGQYPIVACQLSQCYLPSAGERVLPTNKNGISIREQKFFLDVGRPGWPSKHPEQQVEIARPKGIEQPLVGPIEDVNRCVRIYGKKPRYRG